MTVYRLYFMDGFSGQIMEFVQFSAADDADAVRMAEERRRPIAMELWCQSQKIQRWEPMLPNGSAGESQFMF